MPAEKSYPRTFKMSVALLVVGVAIPMLFVAACSSASPSSSGGSSASSYANCMIQHGVTPGASKATADKAAQACSGLAPGPIGSGFKAQFQKFTQCLSSHGVSLPAVSSNITAMQKVMKQIAGSAKAQSAFLACKSDMPTP